MAAIESPPQILGAGTYGVVMKPALPNINSPSFPGNVSKIFHRRMNRNRAKNAANTIKAKVPSLNIPFIPYKKNYRVKNLPPIIQNHFKIKDKTQELYVARMPELGNSFAEIERTPGLYTSVRNISNEVLCYEILKLLRTVKDIKDAGYIHGDIRETNVLCDVKTGKMTIIDFDWFNPADDFLEKYAEFFYSHSPELYLLNNYFIFDESDKSTFLDGLQYLLSQRVIISESHNVRWMDGEEFILEIYAAAKQLWSNIYETKIYPDWQSGIDAMKNKYFETTDMYGLGVALISAFRKILTLPNQLSLREFLDDELFVAMMEIDFAKRKTIEEVIEMLELYIKKTFPKNSERMKPNNITNKCFLSGGTNKKRKTRRRRHTHN